MAAKNSSPWARHSAASMRDLMHQVSELHAALKSLRDTQSGLSGAIHAPQIRSLRSWTKNTTTTNSALENAALRGFGSLIGRDIASDLGYGSGGNIYRSSAQVASRFLAQILRGGRIR